MSQIPEYTNSHLHSLAAIVVILHSVCFIPKAVFHLRWTDGNGRSPGDSGTAGRM